MKAALLLLVVVGLLLLRRRRGPTIDTIWWTKDGWRDFERVDSV